MLGLLATLAFTVGAIGIGLWILDRWIQGFDPAARVGLGGLAGLGALGLLTLPIGLVPGGLRWGGWLVLAVAASGLVRVGREIRVLGAPKWPAGPWGLVPVAAGVLCLMSLVGVLAPSDMMDWDSLAYHLAVPKMWLKAGQIGYVSFIHHSNFPFTIDNLYLWGLWWGGEHGAKAFSWAFLLLGLATLFGLARARYGAPAGWWTVLAFAGVPAVVWLSGTAYIDVSNGLFAGLGIVFAAMLATEPEERRYAWLSAVFLGLAAGSKYTGLQTVLAVALMVLAFGVRRGGLRHAVLIGLVASAIAAPWYIKNVVYTGNPVYPFFYSRLGGKDWSAFNGMIYTEEQKTFGVGAVPSLDPTQIGHAILGLTYQPGRYTNPSPTQGMGMPLGALGVVGLAAALLWCFSGRMRRFEGAVLATVGIGLVMWFVLSQQSRYIVAQLVPLSILAGGAAVRLRAGPFLAGLAGLQAVYTMFLVNTALVSQQLPVVTGSESPSEYLASRVPFSEAAGVLNLAVIDGKVALYDEVFGYFLDVPYIWANPGHSTELGYETMQEGKDLVASFVKHGITHVYLNLAIYPPNDPATQRWLASLGLNGEAPQRFEGQERAKMASDLRTKWKILVSDAVADGNLAPVQLFERQGRPRGLLFLVQE